MKNKSYFTDNAIVIDKDNNTFIVKILENKNPSTIKEKIDWIYGNPFQQYTVKLENQLLAHKLESIFN